MTLTALLDPIQLSAMNIFNGAALQRMLQVEQTQMRFVHYTSAEVAFSILKNAEVWMRRPQLMNDFAEIEWGWDCLLAAMEKGAAAPFRAALDAIFEGSSERILSHFDKLLPTIRAQTYMTCISEHDDAEDELGRLSMWRAYGGNAGVAMVLNNQAFISASDVLNAYTYPVSYHTTADVAARLGAVVEQIKAFSSFLKEQGEEFVTGHIHELLNSIILGTKHPGFKEEREWRIIHNTWPERSPRLGYRHETVRGIPQQIVTLPMRDFPEEGLVGASIPNLINRMIIGPNEFAWESRAVFRDLLVAAGVTDPDKRIWVSNIPVRQQA